MCNSCKRLKHIACSLLFGLAALITININPVLADESAEAVGWSFQYSTGYHRYYSPSERNIVQVIQDYANKPVFSPFLTSDRSLEYAFTKLSLYEKTLYTTIFKRFQKGYLVVPYNLLGLGPIGKGDLDEPDKILSLGSDVNKEISIQKALNAIYEDHPEFAFLDWPGSSVHFVYTNKGIVPVFFDIDLSELQKRILKSQSMLSTASSAVRSKTNLCDVQKIEYIATLVEKNISYDDNSGFYSRSLLGATSNGFVCVGYSLSIECLSKMAGIPAISIHSRSHSWDLVFVNQEWHDFDATRSYGGANKGYNSWTGTREGHNQMINGPGLLLSDLPDRILTSKPVEKACEVINAAPEKSSAKAPPPPRQVTKTKAKLSGKATKLSWGKRPKASGYRVYISKNNGKTWTILKTLKGASKNSLVVKNKNKKYKYKVRAFRTATGKTSWGKCSKIFKAV